MYPKKISPHYYYYNKLEFGNPNDMYRISQQIALSLRGASPC